MIHERLDLTLPGGVGAHLVFTDRGMRRAGRPAGHISASGVASASDEVRQLGASGSTIVETGHAASATGARRPYEQANVGSHVGDDPDHVRANRAELAHLMGVGPGQMAIMRPDHGRGVAVIREPAGIDPEEEVADVDALVTDRPGVALVALGADCAPVLLVGRRAVAAVHSGWRGLMVDVVGAAMEHLTELDPGPFQAVIGPAICGGCYAVPPERADLVAGGRPEAVVTARDGQPGIDLRRGLSARLAELGVGARLVGGCTLEDPALFSHRRLAPTGRQAGAVVLCGGP